MFKIDQIILGVSRSLDNSLQFQRGSQNSMLGGAPGQDNAIDSSRQDNTREEGSSFLSGSITGTSRTFRIYFMFKLSVIFFFNIGSARHRKKLALEALAVVAEKDKPHLFITMTANPLWSEITELLLPGETAFSNMLVTCRVFKAKLAALLANLKNGHYFGGKSAYIIHVIEFQHRGLPHAHIVCRISNGPNHLEEDKCIEWIDRFISAKMPVLDENSTDEDSDYYDFVTSQMCHRHFRGVNGCLDGDNNCSKGYHVKPVIPNTFLDEKKYPVYAKPSQDDLLVVPHNRQLLLDFKCHINVEFAASTYAIIYLFKYLLKGNKKIQMDLNNVGDVHEGDEITLHLRGRMMSSMQATWQVLGYPVYPASDPSVTTIFTKSEMDLVELSRTRKLCDLSVYFNRPAALNNIKYIHFYKYFDYTYTQPGRPQTHVPLSLEPGADADNELQCEQLTLPTSMNITKAVYLKRISNENPKIVRLNGVPLDSGEPFFFRLLLKNIPMRKHLDGKFIDNTRFRTYQEACLARGILTHGGEGRLAFEEAIAEYASPAELRSFFVMLTLQGFPTIGIHSDYFNNLTEDFFPARQRTQLLRIDLMHRFLKENKNMENYGFQLPLEYCTLVEQEVQLIEDNHATSLEILNHLHATQPNTEEMDPVYQLITDAVDNQRGTDEVKYFIIDSTGGSGKTTFAKKVYHYVHTKRKIVLGAAATGLAAQVYGSLDFETVHSLFSVPIIENDEEYDNIEEVQCNTEKNKQKVELIKRSSVIIIDEAFSLDKLVYISIDNSYQKLQGKIVLLLMDRGQTGPIVKFGSREEMFDHTILKLPFWNISPKFSFTVNLRLLALGAQNQQDPHYLRQMEYANSLTLIRTNGPFPAGGQVNEFYHNEVTGEKKLFIIGMQFFTCVDRALAFLYPEGFSTPDLDKRAILATTNEVCDEWNSIIQKMNPNPERILLSANELEDVDDPHQYLQGILNRDSLSYYEKNGVPLHELKLKQGDICFLLRTVSKKDHLSRNTRVRIVKISTYKIQVQTLDESPKLHHISRIRFRITHLSGYTLIRTQFPFGLAYAMTKNKAQGQSLQWMLNDIRNDAFSSGQEFVADSRPTDIDHAALFADEDQVDSGRVLFTNVVYPELLE